MHLIADLIKLSLNALFEKGAIDWTIDDGAPDTLIGDVEIESSPESRVFRVEILGWYVFLWYVWGQLEAYHADELCMVCESTDFVPLQTVQERRMCLDCAAKVAVMI